MTRLELAIAGVLAAATAFLLGAHWRYDADQHELRLGARVRFRWFGGLAWGRVRGVYGTSLEPGVYHVTIQREGPPLDA